LSFRGVGSEPLPRNALLNTYAERGAYTDCFTYEVAGTVSLADFIRAFYTSRAFRPERWILSVLLSMPSTDADVAQLAAGMVTRFAAWTLEQRSDDQILLCDYQSRTRSWLMVSPAGPNRTKLYFGTAVTQVERSRSGRAFARFVFWSLLWFHKAYARMLIGSAAQHLSV
jgi:hypothetical protein